jgi:hypothetical protein
MLPAMPELISALGAFPQRPARCDAIPRPSRVGLIVAVVALAGCVVVPATKVKTSREVLAPVALAEGRKVAVVFSADFSPETTMKLGSDMIECIRKAVRDTAPGFALVSPADFYGAVFPGLVPQQVLIRADTIPALLARPEIRERIDRAGIGHLVLVGGLIERAGFLTGGGAVLVGGWHKDANLRAVIFDLRHGAQVGSSGARAQGSGYWVAPLFIPLGGGVDPGAPSCEALGAEVVGVLQDSPSRQDP